MPITKSAKQSMKKSEVKKKRNFIFRRKYKDAVKDFEKLVKGKEIDKAKELLKNVYSVLDTAVKKNVLHKNTVARKKSRLAKLVNKKK